MKSLIDRFLSNVAGIRRFLDSTGTREPTDQVLATNSRAGSEKTILHMTLDEFFTTNPALKSNFVRANARIADGLIACGKEDYGAGLRQFELGLEQAGPLLAHAEINGDLAHTVSFLYIGIANTFVQLHRWKEALPYAISGLRFRKKAADALSKDIGRAGNLITAHQLLANLHYRAGDFPSQTRELENVLTVSRAMVALDPDDSDLQREHYLEFHRLADALVNRRNAERASQILREAAALASNLVLRNPQSWVSHTDLAICLAKLAWAERTSGKLVRSEDCIRDALKVAERLKEIGIEEPTGQMTPELFGALVQLIARDYDINKPADLILRVGDSNTIMESAGRKLLAFDAAGAMRDFEAALARKTIADELKLEAYVGLGLTKAVSHSEIVILPDVKFQYIIMRRHFCVGCKAFTKTRRLSSRTKYLNNMIVDCWCADCPKCGRTSEVFFGVPKHG